jgi:hypothetical protein
MQETVRQFAYTHFGQPMYDYYLPRHDWWLNKTPLMMKTVEVAIGLFSQEDQELQADRVCNPQVYYDCKIFDPIMIINTGARFDYKTKTGEVIFKKRQPFIAIHLQEVEIHQFNLPALEQPLNMAADFVKRFHLQSLPIVGVTYEALARWSHQLGFKTAEADLPILQRRSFTQDYESSLRYMFGKPMGRIMYCYQPGTEFVERFGTKILPEMAQTGSMH